MSIVTHWSFKEHKYPIDCWRIMPDGMKYLFDQTGKLERYSIGIVSQYDIGARAWKALSTALAVPAEDARNAQACR